MRTDIVGKIFFVVDRELRLCMVCDRLFTGRAAAEHAKAACYPLKGKSNAGRDDNADRSIVSHNSRGAPGSSSTASESKTRVKV